MLAYLDALCEALLSRDAAVVAKLLNHPLADALPNAVRAEATRLTNGELRPFAAPLNTLRLYHQTMHLLGACVDPASRITGSPQRVRSPMRDQPKQMELLLAPARVA